MRRSLAYSDPRPHNDTTLRAVVTAPLGYHLSERTTRFRAEDEDGNSFVATGPGDAVMPDDVVLLKGYWSQGLTDGRFFTLTSMDILSLQDARGLSESLAMQKNGLGRRHSERLLEFFGDDLLEAVESPEELTRAGIAEEKARSVSGYWRQRRHNGRALSQMTALGISRLRAMTVLERYKEDAARLVFEMPYKLAEEIPGIGFQTADRQAMASGMNREDRRRINAGVRSLLKKMTSRGHCCFPEGRLITEGTQMLGVRSDRIGSTLTGMRREGHLVEERMRGSRFFYLPSMHACEIEVAKNIADRIGTLEDRNTQRIIREACKSAGIDLHKDQENGVKAALLNRLSVITGGPGTGKTATMSVLIEAMRILYPDIRIEAMAPTGRAAQRLSESTGLEARTVHRALESSPEKSGFLRDKDNPLEADLVVLDEASMLDIWMMRHLLRALGKNTILILVGDVDQLPSVDAGNVLSDIINTGLVPTTRLTKIFRQAEGSGIALASRRVRKGLLPELGDPGNHSDLWSVTLNSPELYTDAVVEMVTKTVASLGYDPMSDIQVLTPGHEHESGTRALNAALQEAINPVHAPGARLQLLDRELRLGDRVMQLRNNYDLGVYNGDVGTIIRFVGMDPDIPTYARGIEVEFDDRVVEYPASSFDEIMLSYATTIHKSQGSEYPVVVMILTRQHRIMLERPLLYTGLTRAQNLCCIMSDGHAINDALGNSRSAARYTALAHRIREYHRSDIGQSATVDHAA